MWSLISPLIRRGIGMDLSKDSPRITLIENVFYEINDSNKAPASYRITLK